MTWQLADDVTDAVLEARLFAGANTKQGDRQHAEPDWAAVHRELKRKHFTLLIVWEEYIATETGGYRYWRVLPRLGRPSVGYPAQAHRTSSKATLTQLGII